MLSKFSHRPSTSLGLQGWAQTDWAAAAQLRWLTGLAGGVGAVASGLWRVGVYRVGGSPRVASLWLAAEAAANLDPLLPPPLAPGEAPNIRAQLVRGTFDGCGGDSLVALGAGRLRVAQRLRLSVESGKEAADDGRRLAS